MAFSFICSGATGVSKVRGHVSKSVSKGRTWKKVIKKNENRRLMRVLSIWIQSSDTAYYRATLFCKWTSTELKLTKMKIEPRENLKDKNMQKPCLYSVLYQ